MNPTNFFAPSPPSLKICGVTNYDDASRLADLGVTALGFNFWPPSKRFLSPEIARTFAPQLADRILRVGVFVNNSRPLASRLIHENLIDVVQLHGDESEDDVHHFLSQNIPVIRAVAADHLPTFPLPTEIFALLLDTPAGSDYGGTGKTFDWSLAQNFRQNHPEIPLILAGGITPDNASAALAATSPAALDVASGAEISPGQKDFAKVQSLLHHLVP